MTMTAKEYILTRFKKKKNMDEIEIRENTVVNYLLKSFCVKYEGLKVSVIYYPVPDNLDLNLNEKIKYIILYPTSYYCRGCFENQNMSFKDFIKAKVKTEIDNNIEVFKMLQK